MIAVPDIGVDSCLGDICDYLICWVNRRTGSRQLHGRLSIDALIGLGAFAAYGLSVYNLITHRTGLYFDSAVAALVLATFGRYLEAVARSRASRSLGPLLEVSRGVVRACMPDGTTRSVAPGEIETGMTIDRQFLGRLRTFSFVEGISTLLLFGVAMPMKYLGDMPMAVTVVGSVHGVLFLGLVGMFALGMQKVPLPPVLTAAGIVGAVVPFGPFVVDRWLGSLAARASR